MSELSLPDHGHPTAAGVKRTTGPGHVLRAERQRTCVGCRRSDAREDLVRLVAARDGKIVFDLVGGAWGRGAWVHPRRDCLAKSARGLARALRQPISVTPSELHELLVHAAWRRIARLVAAAQRSRQVRFGYQAAEQSWQEGSYAMFLLASDACPATIPPWITEAGGQGRVLVAPSKAAMGEWLGAQEVDLAIITQSRLAKAIARFVAIAETFASARTSRGSDKGTEVG